jgi:hypothetical protein
MSNNNDRIFEPTPRHLWIVGALALLWNSIGAMDYVMTQTANEAYLSAYTDEELAFFFSMPAWTVAAWAIAVWGSVLGAILLLLRKRLSVQVFLVSLLAQVATAFENYVLSNGMEIMGSAWELAFTAVIFLIALALLLYARAMEREKILV